MSHRSTCVPLDSDLRMRRSRGYETRRDDLHALVPADARRIIELGCSTGALGAALKETRAAWVSGVEIHATYAEEAKTRLDRVYCHDVESFFVDPPEDLGRFDCLIAADVLEHTVDPWATLREAVDVLDRGSAVIISVPNVLYWHALLRVMREGRWPRDDAGTFDRTHLRWFSGKDAVELLTQAGLVDVRLYPKISETRLRGRILHRLLSTPLAGFAPGRFHVTGRTPRS